MTRLVSSILQAVASLLVYVSIATYGIDEFYNFIRKEAFTKIHQGLTPMAKISSSLTCMRFDEKMNYVPVITGHCKKWIKK